MQNFSTIYPQLCQIGQKTNYFCIRGDSTFDKVAPGADFLNLKLVIIKQIPYYRPTALIGLRTRRRWYLAN